MNLSQIFLAVFAVLIIFSGMSGVVIGQDTPDNSTTTPTETPTPTATPSATETPTETPTPTPEPRERGEIVQDLRDIRQGPHNITRLKKSGSSSINDSPSVRSMGDPPKGFAAARFRNPNLLDVVMGNEGAWTDIEHTITVRQDRIQVYGSAFGPLSGEYDLVIVYWQRSTFESHNTTVPYAANQTIDRKSVSFGGSELQSENNIQLRRHLDQTWHVTMWLEQDGELVTGIEGNEAQWYFFHRSNPESAPIEINSAMGAWAFTIRNSWIPGVFSLIAGIVGSRITLRQVGRGPGYGIQSWILISTVVGVVISVIAYYQIAVILQNLPWMIGISIGVVSYFVGLTIHPPARIVGFFRRELEDAITIPGGPTTGPTPQTDGGVVTGDEDAEVGNDTQGQSLMDKLRSFASREDDAGAEIFEEMSEALFVDLPEVPAVRTQDGYRVPVKGIRPFIARFFADAAVLDLTSIGTRTRVRIGRIDDLIFIDPGEKHPVDHKPARLVRVTPWDTISEDSNWKDELVAGILTAAMIIVPISLGVIGMNRLLNLPMVGFFLGITAAIILSYSAEDGWIDFEPAPPHYVRAEDNLTMLQRAYKEAKEEQTAKEEARYERAKTATEGRKERQEESRTVTDEVLDALDVDSNGHQDPSDNTIPDPDNKETNRGPNDEEDRDEKENQEE